MEKKIDLRIEKTYRALYNAFTALLEEKRFEDFTLNELCERAMIRRTTFYKHFADKYEYFLFYVKETCSGIRGQFPPDIADRGAREYLVFMCRQLVRFLDRHGKMVENVMSSSMFPMLLDGLAEQITGDIYQVLQGAREASGLTSTQLEGLAAFCSGGIVNVLRLSLRHGRKLDEDEFASSVETLLNSGLWM